MSAISARSRAGHRRPARAGIASLAAAALVASGLAAVGTALAPPALAHDALVVLAGDFQSELGCPGDWTPDCTATALPQTAEDVHSATFTVPAGDWRFKVAVGGTWDEAYGVDGGEEDFQLRVAGDSELRFTFDDATSRTAVEVLGLDEGYGDADAGLVAEPVRQPGADEQFYFVMTDRFADGDPANNEGGIAGERLDHGFDPTDKGFYHGGDIAGLHANLDYIQGLGTTAIWLTPSFQNNPVQGVGADASAGYHGYWITDFTQIDPHLGTNAELEALIEDAHARDIKVYFDIITNHTADIIDYAEGEYSYIDMATRPYTDAAGNPFDPGDYAGTGTFPELDAETSFPYTPVVDPAQAGVKVPGWLNDVTLYHNRGDSTWEGESVTFGDFVGLDDLMTEHPTVVEGFIEVYQDWIDLGIDGFRIDTAKHVNFEFWEEWTTEVLDYAHAQGKDEFFMFGEVYDADARLLSPYVRDTDMNGVLDFAYQSAAVGYARGFTAAGLSGLFAADDYYTTPTTSAHDLPTFLGNHDMGRVGYFLQGSGDERDRSMLAHSLMYLTRGQPVVYYGDEQGFIGQGGDKDARQSLFASEVEQYQQDWTLHGYQIGAEDRYDTDVPLYEHIAALAALRSSTPALETGAQVELHAADGVYAFARVDRQERVEHVVALNNQAADATASFTTLTPGASYTSLHGDHPPVTADASGQVTLTVPALDAVVLVADDTVGAPDEPGGISLSPAHGGRLDGVAPVSADVADDVWAETSFAYRLVGAQEWTALGTAEGDAPRVFHDVSGLPTGTLVEYRAVSVDAAGHRSAASTVGSVGQALDGAAGPEEPVEELVTVPGNHNLAMGCPGDWQPDCVEAALELGADGIYSGTFDLPAGSYEYKVAVDGSWDENYGAGGVPGGDNVAYTHEGGPITFFYDPVSHYFSSTAQGPIITLPGSFQLQAGCPGDWQPDCMATWMTDPDGDGVYEWSTTALATGSYEVKVAHGRSWSENYGAGGVLDGPNIPFSATAGELVAFSYDIATHLLTIEVADPPLPGTGQHAAYWLDETTIAWPPALLPPGADPTTLEWTLHHAAEGGMGVTDGDVGGADASSGLTLLGEGLPDDLAERFPHLADHLALRVDGVSTAEVAEYLTGQVRVLQRDGADATAFTGLQIPGVLDDLYAEAAADRTLGVEWTADGTPALALWAPTATDVELLLWPEPEPAGGAAADLAVAAVVGEPETVPMTREEDGSWTVEGEPGWEDAAYRYAVTVYAPSVDAVVTNEVTDPYAVGLTENSTHAVLVDLDDPRWAPELWTDTPRPVVERPVDRTIYELHVRDFSISDETVPQELRGTYLAFAEEDSAGMAHLRSLAEAGMNTVHLLPTFDIATIEEDPAARTEPDVPDAAPDSQEQQAAVNAVRDLDGFNWGYDPWHFSTPEGSYAVERDGGSRTAEFRTMVGGLHDAGLQVVLDKVYNHTNSSGQDEKSVLDRVVPGYYHRLGAAGNVETSTCCQNVATEHAMAEKLMVDSVLTWATDYGVDGFRFDLMGHHSRDNMVAVREALDSLTLEDDGVDGESIYVYGEGWNFGEVADNARFYQATQGQLDGAGIGTFSDRLRDAVRGGGPFDEDHRVRQGFGSGLFTDPNDAAEGTPEEQAARLAHHTDLVRLGLAGNLEDYAFLAHTGEELRGDELDYNGQPAGYATQPDEVVTYVDAHDNETLYDNLVYKLPVDTAMADRVRMNTLSLATTALAQTPSFWHAGTDLLRSKSLDRNSYNSGDHFNRLDWSMQTNNFGVGLPPADDNANAWDVMRPLLADPALNPGPEDIERSAAMAQDLLELRFSTELFRLGSAELIQEKVSFPGSGPGATPGLLVMAIDDTVGADVDPALDGVLAVFNASPEEVTEQVDGFAGRDLALSPVQAEGVDDVVRGTAWDSSSGAVTVPGRTVAVLVEEQVGQPLPSTTTLRLSRSLATYGEPATATVAVTGGSAAASGPVEIRSNGEVIATGELVADGARGVAEVALPLGAGLHRLTAAFPGTAQLAPSESRVVSLLVLPALPRVTIAAPDRVPRGSSAEVTVSVHGRGSAMPVATGMVTVTAGLRVVDRVPLGPDGTARVTLPPIRAFTLVSAVYSGDHGYLPGLDLTTVRPR